MKLFRSKIGKVLSVQLALSLLFNVFYPTASFALTGGPSQPEVQSFSPIGTSNMVDLFTGDFSYNIPLIDVGGYPINLSYNSNVTMDQEASWVGLGWNVNPGTINRNVRGIPDDFKQDTIIREISRKPQVSFGAGIGAKVEFAGLPDALGIGANGSLGLSYSNYTGYSFNATAGIGISVGGDKSPLTGNLGLDASVGSISGLTLQPSAGFSLQIQEESKKTIGLGLSIGSSYNTITGLKKLTTSSVLKTPAGDASMSSSFSTPTYTPRADPETFSASLGVNVSFGFVGTIVYGATFVKGNIALQTIPNNMLKNEAFGYMYEQHADKNSILDFNREKDGMYNNRRPSLPVTNHTHDVYSASGQGIGGNYRLTRDDIGIVHDPAIQSALSKASNSVTGLIKEASGVDLSFGDFSINSVDAEIEVEIGAGYIVHVGGSGKVFTNTIRGGKWEKENNIKDKLSFTKNPDDGGVYFKQAGEQTKITGSEYDRFTKKLGGFNASRIKLNATGRNPSQIATSTLETFDFDPNATSLITESQITKTGSTSDADRSTPLPRPQNMTFLTTDEAKEWGTDKIIKSYTVDDFSLNTKGYSAISTISDKYRKKHHVAEVSINKTDGSRYIYGIPVYNTDKQEITFSLPELNEKTQIKNGLVFYPDSYQDDETVSKDDFISIKNECGHSQYFENVHTPAYAHSYLLTAIVSPDYIDVTGDGLTPDDLGNYTKFNYSRQTAGYNWRIPVEQNSANHAEGLKSYGTKHLKSDDKGNFIYGSKEVWYLHSIETRDQIAEFDLTSRNDSKGAKDFHGGTNNTNNLQRLDKIRVYSRAEKLQNPNTTPIKTVHFEYDYSLCSNLPNSVTTTKNGKVINKNKGKLTLKQIYFTYGTNGSGRFNPYKFDYSESNYSYDIKAYDRWGNYKGNDGNGMTTSEFPYTSQNETKANAWAQAWLLNKITLPSGGVINVDYESDDYAYVQDRKAMQMFVIEGASNTTTGLSNINSLNKLYNNGVNNTYLFFKVPDGTSNGQMNKYLKKKDELLYFKFLINLTQEAQEYVQGYAQIDYSVSNTIGVTDIGGKDYGYIKVKEVNVEYKGGGDCNINPIAKAGLHFIRGNMPEKVAGLESLGETGIKGVLNAIIKTADQLVKAIDGVNENMMDEGKCKTFENGESWIRLYNPDGNKKGGGSRVKKIAISDEWNVLREDSDINTTNKYGFTYDYTINDYEYDNLVTQPISSGVASYEPIIGNDENPFRRPVRTDDENSFAPSAQVKSLDDLLAPGMQQYMEEPFGESFFPGAVVGYRQVTVKSLANDIVGKHGTGSAVHKFYTAKDYPVQTYRTSVKPSRYKPSLAVSLFDISVEDYMVTSQGYSIVLNDMHGKKEAEEYYSQDYTTLVKKVEYTYAENNNGELSNAVKTLAKTARGYEVEDSHLGLEYDVVADMRESYTSNTMIGAEINNDFFMAWIIPINVPGIWPTFYQSKTRFRSAVLTKVINRSGILEKVTVTDQGATISTENVAYDGLTGQPILTKTQNKYNQDIYSFTLPAYMKYDQMGPAYVNAGLKFKTGVTKAQGDKLGVYGKTDPIWFVGTSYMYGENGSYASSDGDKGKIIQSGYRNMLTAPAATISTLNDNPIQSTGSLAFDNVLNSSLTEYHNLSDIFCENIDPDEANFNPYFRGATGYWTPYKTWVYLDKRTASGNIKTDGTYSGANNTNFWNVIKASDVSSVTHTNWVCANEVTITDPYGQELENKDVLDIYSSAYYGFNNTLPFYIAKNSKYQDAAVENFEDNLDSDNTHFRVIDPEGVSVPVDSEAHTGRKSLKVEAGQSLRIQRDLAK